MISERTSYQTVSDAIEKPSKFFRNIAQVLSMLQHVLKSSARCNLSNNSHLVFRQAKLNLCCFRKDHK